MRFEEFTHCALAYWKSSYHSIYFLEISTLDSSSSRDFLWSMTRHTFWTQWGWRAAMRVKKIQIWSRGKVSAFIVCRFRLPSYRYRNAASSPHNQPWHYRAYGSSIQGHSSILMCDRAASLASLEKPPSRDFIDIAFWHPSFQTLFLLLLKEPRLYAHVLYIMKLCRIIKMSANVWPLEFTIFEFTFENVLFRRNYSLRSF